ncbi:MAG TPA: RHS repeat-associated core domain-containing protein [Candidatus Acidoferrum sp.]|nr:RHS repeat-associated core domain-containing protein [Candidatus Acidoferrum sp.]
MPLPHAKSSGKFNVPPGLDEFFQRTDSSGPRSFLSDALGSTLALADSTGSLQTSYTFEPFGNTTVSGAPSANSFAFTSRELDPSGLYFLRARYYSPSFQRFISEDPIGLAGGGPNLYAYAGDDPVDFIDPLGLYNVWNFWYDAGSFSEAFADTLTFGNASRLNDGLAQAAGRSTPTNRCGWAHGTGTAAGIAFGTVVGGALGADAAAANAGEKGFQFSHWLPARWFRSLEGASGLDLNAGRTIFNGNFVSGAEHALNDPFAYRFMPQAWKTANPMNSAWFQQWNRIPLLLKGAAAGAALTGASAAANGNAGGRKDTSGCE